MGDVRREERERRIFSACLLKDGELNERSGEF